MRTRCIPGTGLRSESIAPTRPGADNNAYTRHRGQDPIRSASYKSPTNYTPVPRLQGGGWCNWQHSGFWSRRYGFESCPPSATKEPTDGC